MKKEEFTRFDPAEILTTEAEISAYLNEAIATEDPSLLAAALGDIAKARGMAELAREVKMTREGLYRALSGKGNPAMSTIVKVAGALGFQFSLQPIPAPQK
ncbi:putative addiction module antidote protein [Aeromonas veronii]|uniref:addiction module antidote protein n=1 Tax=Aeromonas veronii TaxID=654 RepID=UPI000946B57C|nr:addiction module antidote protein [Aeromonas veronii]OLF56789.1 putative addiction module antidote protein [Aeromonas veronii]